MRSVKKQLILFCCLSILALTGCGLLEIDYAIAEDGTIDIQYILAVDQDDSTALLSGDLLAAAESQAKTNGFTTTPYKRESYLGFKATKNIQQVDLKNTGSEMLGFYPLPSIFTQFDWVYKPGLFENSYELLLDVDLRDVLDPVVFDELPVDMRAKAFEAYQASEFTISLTLPGTFVEDQYGDFQVVAGRQASRGVWTLKPGNRETLFIATILHKSQVRDMAKKILVGVLGVFLGLLVLLIHRLTIRKNRHVRSRTARGL